jgi:putative transposase
VGRPEEYRWSSYSSYLSSRHDEEWLCTDEILGQMGKNPGTARQKYRQFVGEGLRKRIKNPLEGVISGIALGGERFWEEVKRRIQKLERRDEIPTLKEVHRKVDMEGIVGKVASFYGISRATVIEKRRPPAIGSQVAMYLTRKKTDLALKKIGAFFGGRHYTAISAAFRRVEQKRRRDAKFEQELSKIEKEIS